MFMWDTQVTLTQPRITFRVQFRAKNLDITGNVISPTALDALQVFWREDKEITRKPPAVMLKAMWHELTTHIYKSGQAGRVEVSRVVIDSGVDTFTYIPQDDEDER